jgi:hypothetical protein
MHVCLHANYQLFSDFNLISNLSTDFSESLQCMKLLSGDDLCQCWTKKQCCVDLRFHHKARPYWWRRRRSRELLILNSTLTHLIVQEDSGTFIRSKSFKSYKILQYQISLKSVQWFSKCYMRKEQQMDRQQTWRSYRFNFATLHYEREIKECVEFQFNSQ